MASIKPGKRWLALFRDRPKRLPRPLWKKAESPTKDHTTKSDIWGVIDVKSGRLRYTIPSKAFTIEIEAGDTAIIEPEIPHHVTPAGAVAFFVEFWRA